MHQDKPSATAWAVALRRAIHQLVDRPVVLEDPLAVRIVGARAAEEALARQPGGAVYRKYSRVMRAVVVGRSRLAEDHLAAAVRAGLGQYVVLGAGLDTFAHRNIHAATGLRVWEVDHPATQAWKRELLAKAEIAAAESLTFVPVDFEGQSLAGRLAEWGFDANRPAFFSWLGVVPYLTLEAFRQTLSFLGSCPPGSHVVFDYAVSLDELGVSERIAFNMLAARVAAAGEPFQLFIPACQMHAHLRGAGFTQIEDLSAGEMNERYFAGRRDDLQVKGNLGRFVHAAR